MVDYTTNPRTAIKLQSGEIPDLFQVPVGATNMTTIDISGLIHTDFVLD